MLLSNKEKGGAASCNLEAKPGGSSCVPGQIKQSSSEQKDWQESLRMLKSIEQKESGLLKEAALGVTFATTTSYLMAASL